MPLGWQHNGETGNCKTEAKILPNQGEHKELDYAEENATQFTEQ
jgi:hypothetical protein